MTTTLPAAPWLNYHHLLYFWTVAKEGSVTKASRQLRLAQPTISAQLKSLEDSLGEKLLEREGRGLKLTEMGKVVFEYAEEIFSLGRELVQTVHRKPTSQALELRVGLTDVLPKSVAYRLLQPALKEIGSSMKIVCVEDTLDRLVGEMAMHELDLVLADTPASTSVKVQSFSHLLGESGLTFLGTEKLYREYHREFPKSMNDAPFLGLLGGSSVRRGLDDWFERQGITPNIVGEFDDSALMREFGGAGFGVFAMPTIIEDGVKEQLGLKVLGRIDEVKQSFYAITVERKIKHPAVVAICDRAKREIFG